MMSPEVLTIDLPQAAAAIEEAIRAQVRDFRRRGAVVGVSGGIDSAVVAALCTRALGPERVLALFMPERDSADESLQLGRELATQLGIQSCVEPLAEILAAAGCYARQNEAVRTVVPDFADGDRFKIVLPSILQGDRLNVSELTVQKASGETFTRRLPAAAYLQLIAATNFKQRTRKMMEYYHADRLNYVVTGTRTGSSTTRAFS